MEEKYTISNIKHFFKTEEIVTDYGRYNNEKYCINYSSILTFLIQKAGKICENYASDLFIDWQSIVEYLNGISLNDFSEKKYLFGFRKSGVDGNIFTLSRLNNYDVEVTKEDIKECYILTIRTEGEEITMSLEKLW